MVAITGSSYGYPGTIDAQQWAEAQPGLGERYWVETAAAGKVTPLGSAARTVRIAAGRISGHGVFDIMTSSVDLVLPNPASGTVYYTVVVRRTWQTTNATTIVAVEGTATRQIAAGLNTTPGVIDDQPLALVAVTRNQNDVVVSDDLRAVGSKGQYEASSELVLNVAGYMDKPGYRIRIAGTEWLRTMAGAWEKIASPSTDTDWVTASLSITNYSGLTWSRRIKSGWGVLKLVGTRSSGQITNVDSSFVTLPTDMRPAERVYGQATVGSNFFRAYIEGDGVLHVDPFTVSLGQNFQVYVTWPIG